MLRVIIAEDEKYLRVILRKALTQIPEVEVIAEVDSGLELVKAAAALSPDATFVDIGLNELDGLEAARRVAEANPEIFIVFATGHDSYTHEAFQMYAFDYLVKPFDLTRVAQTVERIKKMKGERDERALLKRHVASLAKQDIKIGVKSHNRQFFISSRDIILITRLRHKTMIYTQKGSVETIEPLKELDARLQGARFFRCHKGYIINADKVAELLPWGRKTFLVKFSGTEETALMTQDKAREFRDKFGKATK